MTPYPLALAGVAELCHSGEASYVEERPGNRIVRRALEILLLFAIVLFAAFPAHARQAGGEVAVAEESRLAGDEKRTRFVVDLDRALEFRVFVLADPYRVVIDLPETEFRFDPATGEDGRGLISAYRYGLFAPGKSRIVLDATQPLKVDKAFVLEPENGQPARLVVDLVAADRATALAAIAAEMPRDSAQPADPAAPSAGGHSAIAPGEGADSEAIVVVIDPGHGGIDPGAVGRSGSREKEIVLEFSQRLKAALEKLDRFEVHLTREKDVFLPLAERVAFARERKASLFISVHADSVSARSVSGASVYTLSERASDAAAAELAEQENRSDALAGVEFVEQSDEVADILIDLVRRETRNYATHFARTLVETVRGDVPLVKNPHRSAGFRVLSAHDVPSVLLELGFLTNAADEKKLKDDEWQERFAARTAEAVRTYFGSNHARGPF